MCEKIVIYNGGDEFVGFGGCVKHFETFINSYFSRVQFN